MLKMARNYRLVNSYLRETINLWQVEKKHCFHFGLIHLFSKCLLSSYYIQASIVLGTGTTTNKIYKVSVLTEISLVEENNTFYTYMLLFTFLQGE